MTKYKDWTIVSTERLMQEAMQEFVGRAGEGDGMAVLKQIVTDAMGRIEENDPLRMTVGELQTAGFQFDEAADVREDDMVELQFVRAAFDPPGGPVLHLYYEAKVIRENIVLAFSIGPREGGTDQ